MKKRNPLPAGAAVVCAREGITREALAEGLAAQTIALFKSARRNTIPVAVGAGLSVKVNANIGTSQKCHSIKTELEKVKICEECGADAIMDLSTGGDIGRVRREILAATRLPLGTVPIYELAVDVMVKRKNGIDRMEIDHFLDVMEGQAEEGVDFMTIHCGLTYKALERIENARRVMGVVSRGGSLIVEWMKKNRRENPLYEHFDRIMKVAKKYNVVLSLGDGLRPGSTIDATDGAQIDELIVLGELVKRCRAGGVQAIVEGPGHVPIDQIETNIRLQKSLCNGAPFYVLGPLVTDIGAGYDHITSAIGGAWAAYFGADFLCYVTPAEHLKLPGLDDVRNGVVASKIAAHAADLARGNKKAWQREREMAKHRFALDWEGQIACALDSRKAREELGEMLKEKDACSMCGDLCAIKTSARSLSVPPGRKSAR